MLRFWIVRTVGLPPFFPLARAAVNPACVRSLMRFRSNSTNAPKIRTSPNMHKNGLNHDPSFGMKDLGHGAALNMVGLHYFLLGQGWVLYLFSSLLALHHTLSS